MTNDSGTCSQSHIRHLWYAYDYDLQYEFAMVPTGEYDLASMYSA